MGACREPGGLCATDSRAPDRQGGAEQARGQLEAALKKKGDARAKAAAKKAADGEKAATAMADNETLND